MPVENIAVFVGIPHGLLCRSKEVRAVLHTSYETWALWREAGLATISGVGADSEMVMTDEVIRFLNSKPTIGKRRSRAKKSPQAVSGVRNG